MENEKEKAGQPVYSNFNLDSGMEDAFTHQIGLKTLNEMEKKSIWDL